jgi:hypothetical protein
MKQKSNIADRARFVRKCILISEDLLPRIKRYAAEETFVMARECIEFAKQWKNASKDFDIDKEEEANDSSLRLSRLGRDFVKSFGDSQVMATLGVCLQVFALCGISMLVESKEEIDKQLSNIIRLDTISRKLLKKLNRAARKEGAA